MTTSPLPWQTEGLTRGKWLLRNEDRISAAIAAIQNGDGAKEAALFLRTARLPHNLVCETGWVVDLIAQILTTEN